MPFIYGLPDNLNDFDSRIFISRLNTAWKDLENAIGKDKAKQVYISSEEMQGSFSSPIDKSNNLDEGKDENDGKCFIEAINRVILFPS